jgi:hypothetical protein
MSYEILCNYTANSLLQNFANVQPIDDQGQPAGNTGVSGGASQPASSSTSTSTATHSSSQVRGVSASVFGR